jgi:hypothetical protein
MHWTSKLQALSACSESLLWAKTQPDFATAWINCERGDWLLWIAARDSKITRQQLVLAACDCAALALPYTADVRVKKCIETAQQWAKGEVSLDQLRVAANAAYYAADAAANAAYYAADAAAYAAAYAAANAAYAADADAYAAANAAYDAADADAASRKQTLKQCADIVRSHFTVKF